MPPSPLPSFSWLSHSLSPADYRHPLHKALLYFFLFIPFIVHILLIDMRKIKQVKNADKNQSYQKCNWDDHLFFKFVNQSSFCFLSFFITISHQSSELFSSFRTGVMILMLTDCWRKITIYTMKRPSCFIAQPSHFWAPGPSSRVNGR